MKLLNKKIPPVVWYLGLIFIIFAVVISVLTIIKAKNPSRIIQDAKINTAFNPTAHPKEKFSASKYAPFAHQIAPGALSEDAKQALTYFVMQQRDLPDKSIEVKLKPVFQGYSFQTFIVKPGYKMYLATLLDSEGEVNDANEIDFLSRDVPILVDDKGFILNL